MGKLTMVNGKNMTLDYFESFGSMLAYANANPNKKQSDSGDKSFTETANYAEAHKLAVDGWHAVRPEVEKLLATLSEQIDNRLDMVSELEYAVSGGAVDVGRWLTGEPECMFSFVPTPNSKIRRNSVPT